MSTAPKLRRWLDLLAALLGRHLPATFIDVARDVPDYLADGSVALGKPSPTVKRMFERDKGELRAFGIPIVSTGDDGDEDTAYLLRRKDFYLPYLAVMSERGLQAPAKPTQHGYRSLETLAFEPDELEAIRDGANRVTQVGDPALTADTQRALQKLAFDLPFGVTDGVSDDASIIPPVARPDPKVLAAVGDALFRRKELAFTYHSMGAEREGVRRVEPYGLFFLNGHWYLAARDVDKNGLRNFRLSRMTKSAPNTAKPDTPDYEIPPGFSLRKHARSRRAWEIGDDEGFEAVVEFRGESGAARAAAELGRADDAEPRIRRFDVRRMDSFARWLLAFGGDAIPVAPAALVDEFQSLVKRTRDTYSSEAAR